VEHLLLGSEAQLWSDVFGDPDLNAYHLFPQPPSPFLPPFNTAHTYCLSKTWQVNDRFQLLLLKLGFTVFMFCYLAAQWNFFNVLQFILKP